MRTSRNLLDLFGFLLVVFHPAVSAPQGFPQSGNGLWYNQSGRAWSKEWLPVGNGYLAAMVPGGTTQEITQLNIESLWTGGPFADPDYNGGNKPFTAQVDTANLMEKYRQAIFESPNGEILNIDPLGVPAGEYGSYAGAGHLVSTMNLAGSVSKYGRWLDMDQGLARTSWTQNNTAFLRTTFCSHPTRGCIQHLTTSNKKPLPTLTYAFSSDIELGLPAPNVTCINQDTLLVSGYVSDSPSGMGYAFMIRAYSSSPSAQIHCTQIPVLPGAPSNGTLQVTSSPSNDAWVAWMGDTEYDMDAGTPAQNFSFKGVDPITKLLGSAPPQTFADYSALLAEHIADIKATLSTPFALDLGQAPVFDVPTDVVKSRYTIDGPNSNAYLDWLLFNYGRYLLVSSARGTLPANLQGKWADGFTNAWGADYHANINIQMNYWSAEMTGLGDLTLPLFDYFEKTWAPRGQQTAEILYNITRGWVTHNEMNIFGHTGMKTLGNSALWANYPEANVWMMFHVWDHFDHTNDIAWWKAQGWPLLKGVASFHLDKLIPDLHFNDSTLVTAPCNSPEQEPITFGCAHAQQMIWQLFNAVEKGFAASEDTDTAFLKEVLDKRERMDKGVKVGGFGQLQEWKVDKDKKTDTHRHLSHLIGLYPGYAIINFDPSPQVQGNGPAKGYTKAQVTDAATVSLNHRGNGTGPDADAGWEKEWRAAARAQLGDSKTFYHEISYATSENFGDNLFSLYNPQDPAPIFQIDANLGYPAAVMNALLQAPDVASLDAPLSVTLLPALPKQWATSGSIRGARIRGGITVDFEWKRGKLVSATFTVDSGKNVKPRPVVVVYDGRVRSSFKSFPGFRVKVVA